MVPVLAMLGLAFLFKSLTYFFLFLGGSFQQTLQLSTVRAEAMELVFTWACFFGIYLWIDHVDAFEIGLVLIWCVITLLIAIISIYPYVIKPLLIRRNSSVQRDTVLEQRYASLLGNTKVFTTTAMAPNAYAVGLLPGLNFVLISQRIVDEFSEHELAGLIAHELAHLRLNHSFKLYAATCLAIVCGMALNTALAADLRALISNDALRAIACGGLFVGVPLVLIPALFQRNYEHQADLYAARITSAVQVEAMLRHLDELSLGSVTRGGLNYPGLAARIRHLYL